MSDEKGRRPPAVVFDVGGVLAVPPFDGLEAYGAVLGLPPGTMSGFFYGDPEFSKVERGELAVRDFFISMGRRVQATHGVRLDLRRVAELVRAAREFRPGMLELARRVAVTHVVGVLTNNVKENDGYLQEHLTQDVFSHVVNSGVAGARKPEPGAYTYLLDQLGVPGKEVVYVDDFPENLPPAAELGMTTILFTSEEQCRAELVAAGVDVGETP